MTEWGDDYFMQLALRRAEHALQKGKFPVGAIVALDGRPIGLESREVRIDHAEGRVIRQVFTFATKEEAARMTLYTTLEPCLMCVGTILNCRIGQVAYAFEDPYGGGAHLLSPQFMPPRHRDDLPKLVRGLMRAESRVLLRRFFETTTSSYWRSHPENPLLKAVFQDD